MEGIRQQQRTDLASTKLDINPLDKRINREQVTRLIDKRHKTQDAARDDMRALAARRKLELRSFKDLFTPFSFVDKILEHIGGITRSGKKPYDTDAVKSLCSKVNFEEKEICFAHYYPRIRFKAKLFDVRGDKPRAPFTFYKGDKDLYQEVQAFFKSKGLPENPDASDLEDIFRAAGWKVKDPKEVWRWEVYTNKDTLKKYGIIINNNDTFTFNDDIGAKNKWNYAQMRVLIGNRVQSISLENFPRRDFIVETLHHEKQTGSNKRIGSTVQLRKVFEALGFEYVNETPKERAAYDRRLEHEAVQQRELKSTKNQAV